jgi:hypothetical protein
VPEEGLKFMGWFKNAIKTGLSLGVGFASFNIANNWMSQLFGFDSRSAQRWMDQGGGGCARGCYDQRGIYQRQAALSARMDRIEYNQAMLNYRMARAGI